MVVDFLDENSWGSDRILTSREHKEEKVLQPGTFWFPRFPIWIIYNNNNNNKDKKANIYN